MEEQRDREILVLLSLCLSIPPSLRLLYSGERALAMILSAAMATLGAASFE